MIAYRRGPGCWTEVSPGRSDAETFGRGLFETLPLEGGRVRGWDRHWRRLTSSAPLLGLEGPPDGGAVRRAAEELVPTQYRDGTLRLILRGTGPGQIDLILEFGPPRPPLAEIRAIFAPFPRSEHSPLSRVKSLNQLENLLAREAAARVGVTEAIFLNTAGRVTEGSFTNLFLVTDGRLKTPPVTEGLLPGVTRELVLEAIADLDLTCEVAPVRPEELSAAQEIFLTSSLRGLVPVVELGDIRPTADAVSKRLQTAYRRRLEAEG